MFVSQVGKGDKEDEDDQANGQRHLKPELQIHPKLQSVLTLTIMTIDNIYQESDMINEKF